VSGPPRSPLLVGGGGCALLTEVGVRHGLGGGQPLLVVVAQQLVQQVQGLRADQVLVLRLHKVLPVFPVLPCRTETNKQKQTNKRTTISTYSDPLPLSDKSPK